MHIPKTDAHHWFTFFAQLPEEETLSPRQQEIVLATLSQIEAIANHRHVDLLSQIRGLQTLENRTYFVGNPVRFPGGCRSCLMGTGLTAVRKTNRCNLACPFCYDYGQLDQIPPVGDHRFQIGGVSYHVDDIPLLLSVQMPPTGVAYVYLEPFLEIEQYYPAIRAFHEAGVHQHLYTNGTLCKEENLAALGTAGLDEIRFNLGATDCADSVIRHMAIAKRHIPTVGIETPMTPNFWDAFLAKKEAILKTGIDFINCAELHLTPNNIANYAGDALYMARMGYISPIYSREISLSMMAMAQEEQWDIVVHDCSNRTKFVRDMHLAAKEGGWFGKSSYACEFQAVPYAAFLPILSDPRYPFLTEEPMPEGYRLGDIVI